MEGVRRDDEQRHREDAAPGRADRRLTGRDAAGRGPDPRRGERGSGLLSTLFGVAAVVVMIGFAANVCVGVWTRSTVEAVAQDAARDLAASPAGSLDGARVDEVLRRARARLGPTGEDTELTLVRIDEDVVLRVRHPGVDLLPRMLDGAAVGRLDELIVVRREGAA